MSGHAYSGEDLNKIRHAYVFHDGEFKKLRKAWYFKNGEFHQVWSGASEVSYYDGNTLLGVEEVDEGEDVLHPSLDTSKTGYTLVGWKNAYYGDQVTELTATGEPMALYAMYLPDTLTVASGYFQWDGYGAMVTYYNTRWDSEYLTGSPSVSAELWYSEGTKESTAYFTLNKKFYQTASITVGHEARADNATGRFDGTEISKGHTLTRTIGNGSHSMYARVIVGAPSSTWHISRVGVTSLVLSNPTPWT